MNRVSKLCFLAANLVGLMAAAHPPTTNTVALKTNLYTCVGNVEGQTAIIRLEASLLETTVIATQAKSRSFQILGSEVSQNRRKIQVSPDFALPTATEPITESIAAKLKSLQPSKVVAWRADSHLTMPGEVVDKDGTYLASYGFRFTEAVAKDAGYPRDLNFNFESNAGVEATFQNPKFSNGVEGHLIVPFTSGVQISDLGSELKLNLQLKGRDIKDLASNYEFYGLKGISAGDQILNSEFQCKRIRSKK